MSDLEQFEQALEYHKRLPAQLDSYCSRTARSWVLSPKLDIEQAYTMLMQVEFERIFLHRKGSVWILR